MRLRASILRLLPLAFLALSPSALAQSYPGQRLLEFGSSYIIAPLGIFAVVVALAGSFFRPDLVRAAIYAAIICAVLFFVIRSAPALMSSMKG